jgi:hypothetical protein
MVAKLDMMCACLVEKAIVRLRARDGLRIFFRHTGRGAYPGEPNKNTDVTTTMIPPHTKAVIMSLTQSQLIFMTPD